MVSMLLGISYKELLSCINFKLSAESNDIIYWDAPFSHDTLGLTLSLSDIDVSFDTMHYHCKHNTSTMYYQSKTAALCHLLLKLIMIVKPNAIGEWMKKSNC
eukprot:6486023-Ditylum_brightwellii.AAC.1